jgi:predicted dehydrogenase
MSLPPLAPPKVSIIGHGYMGDNHRRKVEALETHGKARLVCVVDRDSARLTNLNVPTYLSLEEAYEKTLPDIVAICTNTKTHATLLERTHALSERFKNLTHVLVEKPLAANSKEGKAVQELYSEHRGCLSSGYLFRQSPIISVGIGDLKRNALEVTSIHAIWQKDRVQKGPPRPSEGVHIDEATHPIDLVVNCILPQLGIQVDGVTILRSSCKRQSEVGQIVDQEKQQELYADDPSKLDPVAEVEYELNVGGVPFTGLASFVRTPQRRELTLKCNDGTTFFFEFDTLNGDRLSKTSSSGERACLCEQKTDKLMLEWEAFLNYCTTGEKSYRIQTPSDMLFDICLTEALGQNRNEPIVINFD